MAKSKQLPVWGTLLSALLACALAPRALGEETPVMGPERAVLQTEFGDITVGFYPEVAPETAAHILKLMQLGAYNTNHFFRVDKGFVAQVADVQGGRQAKMSTAQHSEATKTMPLECVEGVKHHKGVLSLARHSDPHSGGSSFSILLGDAPHLDMQYAVFGRVVSGLEVLDKMQEVETRRDGIFVMPLNRITIFSTYVYTDDGAASMAKSVGTDEDTCEAKLEHLKMRFNSQENELHRVRKKCLP